MVCLLSWSFKIKQLQDPRILRGIHFFQRHTHIHSHTFFGFSFLLFFLGGCILFFNIFLDFCNYEDFFGVAVEM